MPSIFNPAIPVGTNLLSVDYLNIQNNMSQLDTSFGVNHFKFSDNTANNGLHTFVQMPVQTLPTIAASQGAVYTNTANGQSQLFYTADAPASNNKIYQLTRVNDAQYAIFSTNTQYPQIPAVASQIGGWTFLPGGMILQYGSVSNPGAGSTLVKFPLSFTTGVYSLQLTARNDGSHSAFTYYVDGAPSTTGFSYRGSSSGSNTLFWMAIGV